MPITIFPKLPSYEGPPQSKKHKQNNSQVILPGEVIFTSGSSLITGHGTYKTASNLNEPTNAELMDTEEFNNQVAKTLCESSMHASLAGRIRTVNKLVYVEPLKARYSGNVGDTIVGRIVGVEQRRWLVDVNSYQHGILQLANVKLPGGELRRKSEDDERAMRSFMKEGDLIVAEVHDVYRDGSLQLHMPGVRTGRLGEGCFASVAPSSIKKQKLHRHQLNVPKGCGSNSNCSDDLIPHVSVGLILGCNGYVWIGPARGMALGTGTGASLLSLDSESMSKSDLFNEYLSIARVRNCVLALASSGVPVWELSVLASCEASWIEEKHLLSEPDSVISSPEYGVVSLLSRPDVRDRIMDLVKQKLGL
ncbi:Exosome complex component RRP4 [Cichlidogyrus casuarinus]|uniref:Exosome complex component RRP4 n=1 Tax=Cichlidogyrus casuarinus TaxID=1844966 RepID=A0ABD2Q7W5_9PLAT